MKKLLIGAIVAVGVVAVAVYIKRKFDDCFLEPDYCDDDCDCNDDVEEEVGEEESVDEIADTADNSPQYDDKIAKMVELLDMADRQIKDKNFAFGMMSIRLGMETGVKCVVFHGLGNFHYNGLGNDIKICQEHGLLSDNFINDLQEARRKCNNTVHSIEENSGYDDALFCYRVLEELIDKVREFA